MLQLRQTWAHPGWTRSFFRMFQMTPAAHTSKTLSTSSIREVLDLLLWPSLKLTTRFICGKIHENSRIMQRWLTVSDGSSFHKNDTEDDEQQAHLGAGGIPAHTTGSVTSRSQTDPSLKQILTGQETLPPQAPACSQVCTGESWGRFLPVSGQRPREEHRQKICY